LQDVLMQTDIPRWWNLYGKAN